MLNKFYFKQNDETPDSVFYGLLTKFFKRKATKKVRTEIVGKLDELKELKGSYLLLANHSSYIDYTYINDIQPEKRYAYIVNRYYFGVPFVRILARHVGFIPKRIFAPDMDTIKKSLKMRDLGYPIMMFPEGRLSSDGKIQSINPSIGRFAMKLNVPIVLVRIDNAYLVNPKWRKKIYGGTVTVNVEEIIKQEELASYTNESLYDHIKDVLTYDTYNNDHMNIYNQKNKAVGLENLLYMCPNYFHIHFH